MVEPKKIKCPECEDGLIYTVECETCNGDSVEPGAPECPDCGHEGAFELGRAEACECCDGTREVDA